MSDALDHFLGNEPEVPTYETPYGLASPMTFVALKEAHDRGGASPARMWATLHEMDLADERETGVRGTRSAELEERLAVAAMEEKIAEMNHLIETCHERVACPRCGAPVGAKCAALPKAWPVGRVVKPHKQRWTQEVPER